MPYFFMVSRWRDFSFGMRFSGISSSMFNRLISSFTSNSLLYDWHWAWSFLTRKLRSARLLSAILSLCSFEFVVAFSSGEVLWAFPLVSINLDMAPRWRQWRMPSVLRIKIVSRNAELEVDCQEGTITIEMMAWTEKIGVAHEHCL